MKPGQLHPQQDSAVSLPASLFRRFHDRENIGIYFTIYESATLFPVNDSKVPGEQTKVGSQVVGINVDSSQDLVDLEEPIIIVLRPQLEQDNLTVIASLILIELTFVYLLHSLYLVLKSVFHGTFCFKIGLQMDVRPVSVKMELSHVPVTISPTIAYLWYVIHT